MRDWLLQRSWNALLGAVLLASVVFNIAQSDGYLSVNNFVNLFELSIEKIIVVVAMTFVIVAGEIDLSVASVMGFAACVMASLHERSGLPFWLILLVTLVVSALIGLIQGLIITLLELPSLVVTLAGLIAWRGAARILVEDRSVGQYPDWFNSMGQDDLIGPLPFAILLFVGVLALGAVLLHRTVVGRYLYVIGDKPDVARYSGVRVDRVRTSLFVASSTVAGLAGILFAARLGTARADLAYGFELEIITIVLLGGVSIFGGSGRMSGVALAILIVLNVRNGLGLAGVDGSTQVGVIGVILIASVLVQNALGRVTARRQRQQANAELAAIASTA
jgi:rhamnose transport system permease protein